MIETTTKIEAMLSHLTPDSKKKVLKAAWDLCCDGEYLKKEYDDIGFDPWDGEHKQTKDIIEYNAVYEALLCHTDEL